MSRFSGAFVAFLGLLCVSSSLAATGYWDVCGPSNLYSTDYQICCGEKIYQNFQKDIDCCNGIAFNKTVNVCYNNQEIRAVVPSLPAQTPAPPVFFGSLPIQPRIPIVLPPSPPAQAPAPAPQVTVPVFQQQPPPPQQPATVKPSSGYRCGSAVLDSSVATTKTTLCCGNVPFDARYQLCSDFGPAPIQAAGIQGALTVSSPEKYYTCGLDQVPSSAVTSFDTAFCCGTVVYDSRFYTCTRNNAVIPQVPLNSGPGVSVQQPPENRPRPSAYPPVADGFTRVRCLSNLFDVPTNHMTYYSCCGSQAFDERYFVCTSTGSGTPQAQPIGSQSQVVNPPAPAPSSISVSLPQQPSASVVAPAPSQRSNQLQCGKRIYLFGPPTYGANMQCCGEDIFDTRTDTCVGSTKVSG